MYKIGDITDNGYEVIQVTDDFYKVKTNDGYEKVMIYKEVSTFNPQTTEDKKALYTIMNDVTNSLVTQMKNWNGKTIKIKNYCTKPYTKFDKKTGKDTEGVTTTIEDVNGSFFATSSKSVYWTIKNITDIFGKPGDDGYEPVEVRVELVKRNQGEQTNIVLV